MKNRYFKTVKVVDSWRKFEKRRNFRRVSAIFRENSIKIVSGKVVGYSALGASKTGWVASMIGRLPSVGI